MSRKNKQPKIETPIIESESVSQVPSFITEEVAPEVIEVEIETGKIEDHFESVNLDLVKQEPIATKPKLSYFDRITRAIENRKQRKDAAKANAKAGQGLEGQEG
jgi:hypothetical protein